MAKDRSAILVRMVLPDHTCPYGVRAKALLDEHGYQTEEQILKSREDVEAYKEENGVETTPQIFIQGERIGGCDDLERFLQSS